MSLRLQYSLRQALAVALFGLPLPILEQILSWTISGEEIEFVPSLMTWMAMPGLTLLVICTLVRAYERFEDEFQPPLESTAIVGGWLRGLFMLGMICVVAIGSTGWPTNEYHWARAGIIGLGLHIGWLLAKWTYFDWLERVRSHPDRPDEPPASGVTAPPILPTGVGNHRSAIVG